MPVHKMGNITLQSATSNSTQKYAEFLAINLKEGGD